MKKLFVIVISILIVMQAAWIVGAKDMSQDNELSLAIEKNKITNGRLWYNGSEYVLDAILFDGFESGFLKLRNKTVI